MRVLMCPVGTPVAATLLWHPAQPVVKVVWSTLAGFQASVPWHTSHDWVVGMCVRGMPAAFTALWQLVQVCGATAARSKRAGVQALVVWQLSRSEEHTSELQSRFELVC